MNRRMSICILFSLFGLIVYASFPKMTKSNMIFRKAIPADKLNVSVPYDTMTLYV